jgi:acyl-CoA thioester hydrolase
MARIRIDLPASFKFETEVPLRITDINYGGHLGNDAVLGLVHEARLQFLKHLGFSELDIGGASLIMADVGIRYLSEAFYGDTLLIHVAAGEFTSHGFELSFKLTSKTTGKDVAHAKTGLVAFDYTTRKVVALPEAFREALK